MNEENILIVRYGEAALKGMNKPYFEKAAVRQIRHNLRDMRGIDVRRQGGLIFVRVPKENDKAEIISRISKIFGIASISPAVEAQSDLDEIGTEAVKFMKNLIETEGVKTFKVEAKRADKNFPVKSPEIARIIGAKILIGCKVLSVDVHDPDVRLFVDLRSDRTYIYEEKIAGFGGLPIGTNGKGLVLLSGGIDSPVAAWMMAKRGMRLEAVHFHSYPYTSQRARQKVIELAEILTEYTGSFKLHIVNLKSIQEKIVQHCPEPETTIHVRRFMMRIAERIARKTGCSALITGESLGQVASQTSEALAVTDASVGIPVFRPLIALDKVEIIERSKKIGAFEKSIEPYEDCCTVFLPKHPTTKPRLDRIEMSENKLDVEKLIDDAIAAAETLNTGDSF